MVSVDDQFCRFLTKINVTFMLSKARRADETITAGFKDIIAQFVDYGRSIVNGVSDRPFSGGVTIRSQSCIAGGVATLEREGFDVSWWIIRHCVAITGEQPPLGSWDFVTVHRPLCLQLRHSVSVWT